MAFWVISPVLPAKPSAAGSPGRGGARKRSQFSPLGGNGDKRTLRRRAAMGKVTRRPQAAKSPAYNERSPNPAPSSVTASPCRLSLSPLSLRDIIPTPFGLRPFPPDRGNRPLDKGSRPPRGRLLGGFGPLTKNGSRKAGQRRGGEIPRTLYLLWLKPPQSGFNKEGSTHETNQMRKRRNLQT